MGRWTSESASNVMNPENWRLTHMSHITRGPLMHLHFWIQGNSKGGLCELVCQRAASILSDWEAMTSDSNFSAWGDLLETCDGDAQLEAKWLSKAMHDILEYSTDFYKRIVLPCRTFP
eukprot:10661254-Alexandrium_andersonii.AAC.1